jgi:hypothetical protein
LYHLSWCSDSSCCWLPLLGVTIVSVLSILECFDTAVRHSWSVLFKGTVRVVPPMRLLEKGVVEWVAFWHWHFVIWCESHPCHLGGIISPLGLLTDRWSLYSTHLLWLRSVEKLSYTKCRNPHSTYFHIDQFLRTLCLLCFLQLCEYSSLLYVLAGRFELNHHSGVVSKI